MIRPRKKLPSPPGVPPAPCSRLRLVSTMSTSNPPSDAVSARAYSTSLSPPCGGLPHNILTSSGPSRPLLFPDDLCPQDHGTQFPVSDVSGQIFHATVRRHQQPLWRHIGQGGTDALGYHLGRFRSHIVQIQDAKHDTLGWQGLQDGEVQLWLGRLYRYLLHRRVLQLREKGIGAGLLSHRHGVAKTQMHRSAPLHSAEGPVDSLDSVPASLAM